MDLGRSIEFAIGAVKLFAEMVTSVFSKIVGIGRVFGFNAASAVASLDRSLVARVVRDGAIAKLLERHVNRPVIQCFGADIVDAGKNERTREGRNHQCGKAHERRARQVPMKIQEFPLLHLLVVKICWGGRPPNGIKECQSESIDLKRRRPSVGQIIRIGVDTSKHLFQLHGVNAAEQPVLRRKMRRIEMIEFFKKLPPTVIAIEACGGSHHWARLLGAFGHEVKLIAPQLAKPYVKRGKNDAADAEALCEAMSRPTMRFVPVKTADQQASLMLVGMRARLVRNRTQLANAIRGYAAEFGLTAARGMCKIEPLLDRIATDETVPALARELFAAHARDTWYPWVQWQLAPHKPS